MASFPDRLIAALEAFNNPPPPEPADTLPTRPTTSGDVSASDEEEYETFMTNRQLLTQLEWDQAKSFDQAMITLSGGALVLSVTFIDKLSDSINGPRHLYMLYPAWGGLGLALLAILLAFWCSQHAAGCERLIRDREYEGETDPKKLRNRWTQLINWLSAISIVAFIIGVGSLALFSARNLS